MVQNVECVSEAVLFSRKMQKIIKGLRTKKNSIIYLWQSIR